MIDMPPLPPAHPTNIEHECVIGAAAYYQLPPELIVAVRQQEAGTRGRYTTNTNGTADLGPMAINTIHLKSFAQHGITKSQLLNDSCTNIFAGAHILRREISRAKDTWTGVGNYHSRTAKFHWRYRTKVSERLQRLTSRYGSYVQWLRHGATRLRQAYIAKQVVKAEGN